MMNMEMNSLENVLLATAASFFVVIVASAVVDFLVIRPLFIPKAQYFALHALFNFGVMIVVAEECFLDVIWHPLNIWDVPRSLGGVTTTAAIGAFHVYHTIMTLKVFGGTGLNKEDWLHHLISGMGVPVVGIAVPYGKVLSLVNFFMCGLPGALDYCMLVAVKYGWMDRLSEKNINRFINLLLRMPAMQLTGYLIAINMYHGNIPAASQPIMTFFMVLGYVLHATNAVYYCDKVVGNSWVCAAQDKAERMAKKAQNGTPNGAQNGTKED